jgi:hypothetical protein
MIYTVTTMRSSKSRSRCQMYFSGEISARRAIELDRGYLWEDGYYKYAVIERVTEGTHPEIEEVAWYYYDDSDPKESKIFEIEKPREFRRYRRFSMG